MPHLKSRNQPNPLPYLPHRHLQQRLIFKIMVQIRPGAPPAPERPRDRSRPQKQTHDDRPSVEKPGDEGSAAAGGDFPGADFGFAAPVGRVARQHVMDVVEAGDFHPGRDVGHINREFAHAEDKPFCRVSIGEKAESFKELSEGGFDGQVFVVNFHRAQFSGK